MFTLPCEMFAVERFHPLYLQVWLCMHYILWRIKKLEGLAGATDDDADLLRQNARAWLVVDSGGCHLSIGHLAMSLTCSCARLQHSACFVGTVSRDVANEG